MIRRRTLLLAVLALAVGAMAVFGFRALFEPVTTRERLPPTGEARFNPLYALMRSLQAQGVPARSFASLGPTALALGAKDTLVLYTQPEAITGTQTRRLITWVRGGGHLVMPGPGYGETPGPLAEALKLRAIDLDVDEDEDAEEDEPGAASDEIDAKALPSWSRDLCTRLSTSPPPPWQSPKARRNAPAGTDERAVLELCGPRFTSELRGFRLRGGDSLRGYRFGRVALDRGLVTVMPLHLLGNANLEKPIATDLAYQLLAPRLGQGAVHLVYSADVPSLAQLLIAHGWRALLPALLALAAWLLWRSQRFGPRVPAPTENRRALLEHVQAAGEFAYRRGRMLALHAAVLASFRKRLALRDPLLAALAGEAQVAALAERLSLDPERVRRALAPIGLQRPDVFLHCISTLVLMRNRL